MNFQILQISSQNFDKMIREVEIANEISHLESYLLRNLDKMEP